MARTETVTVVFTDLVGSTELASRLGHDAYEALRHEHFTALRTGMAGHTGTEIKTTGDGLMLSFTSAADAIACGIAMQQAVALHRLRAEILIAECGFPLPPIRNPQSQIRNQKRRRSSQNTDSRSARSSCTMPWTCWRTRSAKVCTIRGCGVRAIRRFS